MAHLDLKSPNVLIKSLDPMQDCAKISDFGTAKLVYEPIVGTMVENPIWLAPEVSSGQPYTELSDIYSCGVIFWELYTREKYFGHLTFPSDIQKSVEEGARPPIPEHCPEDYARIIKSCWV